MALAMLQDRQVNLKVVLLYTQSNSLELFIEDMIRRRFNINNDNIVNVTSKKELKQTEGVSSVVPFLSDRWLFKVPEADKVVGKEIVTLVRKASSGVYLLKFEKYRDYIKVKKLLDREQGVLDLYLAFLRKDDFTFLYKRVVLNNGGYVLTKPLLDFVSKGYSGEVESLFTLFNLLKDGQEVKTRKQVIDICGLSANTIDNFMFSLLKEPNLTKNGLKKYNSNRIVEAVDLAERYSWRTFRNYLRTSVKSCIDIKMILSSGEIYDDIRNYENEGYEVKRLKRYQRFLYRIKEINIAKFLGLLDNLDKRRWESDLDFLNFFYNYSLYKYNSNVQAKKMLQELLDEQKKQGLVK